MRNWNLGPDRNHDYAQKAFRQCCLIPQLGDDARPCPMFATEPVGGLSFLNTKFKEFPAANISFPNPNGPGLIIGTGDADGNRLPLAQKFAGTLTAEYTTRVSFGELKLSVTENHYGSYFFDPDNVPKERKQDV